MHAAHSYFERHSSRYVACQPYTAFTLPLPTSLPIPIGNNLVQYQPTNRTLRPISTLTVILLVVSQSCLAVFQAAL